MGARRSGRLRCGRRCRRRGRRRRCDHLRQGWKTRGPPLLLWRGEFPVTGALVGHPAMVSAGAQRAVQGIGPQPIAAPEKWGLLGAADVERWGRSSSRWSPALGTP
ncbi:protein of unknown function [Microbacterium sp. Nx66]|nr:protein of unknown function [Microbacterium sp. Nx66]